VNRPCRPDGGWTPCWACCGREAVGVRAPPGPTATRCTWWPTSRPWRSALGGSSELLDGSPVADETLRRLACDCGVVRHLLRGGSQPLDVGTRTPVWTVAQRRVITVRDRGHCRFVACEWRTCDVHHVHHFADGGPTAVGNGILICPRHHTAVHEGGFRITGEPNGTLTFHRPDGSVLGTSTPASIDLPAAVA
jgi:hypothetical protein